MKNNAESMPNPAQQPERPKIESEDIESLMKAFEEHDAEEAAKRAAEEAKEKAFREAVSEIDKTLDAKLLESEFEKSFEAIQDKDAIAIDRQVEETLKESEVAATPEAGLTRMSKMDRLGDAEVKGALVELMRSRAIDVVLENYKHDFAQSALFDKPFGAMLETMGLPAEGDIDSVADKLNRDATPGYATMTPEAQAEARSKVAPMAANILGGMRNMWRDGVLEIARNKRRMLEDNRQQLEEALAAEVDAKKRDGLEESLKETQRRLGNADMLISGFEDSSF